MTIRALMRLLLGLAALLGLAGPAPAADSAGKAAEREILVMLKLAPPHFRPNSSYGGSYGDARSSTARKRIAQDIAAENRMEVVDSWPMPLLGVDCYVMKLPPNLSVDDAIARVSRHAMVEWSQPMNLFRARAGPTNGGDPLFRASPAATSWHLADLHRVSTGRGVNIAVIDSKVDVDHPDLSGQFTQVEDFVRRGRGPEAHGTAVAGVIGAKANNGIGTAGVAPGARLMALRACWQTGRGPSSPTLCDSLSLARALQYAIEHDAEVINLSLSGPSDKLLRKLIALALARRASVVAAYDPSLPKGGFPASQPGVIAVMADSLQDVPARLYAAPGRNVPTTQPGGKWNLVSGSSYAAAHVSGLVALVREKRRSSRSITLARSSDGTIDACATLLRSGVRCDVPSKAARQVRAAAKR